MAHAGPLAQLQNYRPRLGRRHEGRTGVNSLFAPRRGSAKTIDACRKSGGKVLLGSVRTLILLAVR